MKTLEEKQERSRSRSRSTGRCPRSRSLSCEKKKRQSRSRTRSRSPSPLLDSTQTNPIDTPLTPQADEQDLPTEEKDTVVDQVIANHAEDQLI